MSARQLTAGLRVVLIAGLGAGFFLVSGCSPESMRNYNSASDRDEVVRLLNERQYQKAAWALESRRAKNPGDQETNYLLAQAWLGMSGFELLQIAGQVVGPQADGPPANSPIDDSNDPSRAVGIFAKCPSQRLARAETQDPLCVLKRVHDHTPSPDLPGMIKARELLRKSYPDPAAAPQSVNTLIGAVELAAVAFRAVEVYAFVLPNAENPAVLTSRAEWLASQFDSLLIESRWTLRRAEHSYKRVSKLLTGLRENEVFQLQSNILMFTEGSGLRDLLAMLEERAAGTKYEEFAKRFAGKFAERRGIDLGAQ